MTVAALQRMLRDIDPETRIKVTTKITDRSRMVQPLLSLTTYRPHEFQPGEVEYIELNGITPREYREVYNED